MRQTMNECDISWVYGCIAELFLCYNFRKWLVGSGSTRTRCCASGRCIQYMKEVIRLYTTGVNPAVISAEQTMAALSFIIYLLQAFSLFRMGRKADIRNAWMSFIPILQLFVILSMIKRSWWNVLWVLVPIADIIFAIIWYIRLFRAFGVNPWWLLLTIIPFVNGIFIVIAFAYMGFSSAARYNPDALSR